MLLKKKIKKGLLWAGLNKMPTKNSKFGMASYYPKKYMLKYNYTGKFTSLD